MNFPSWSLVLRPILEVLFLGMLCIQMRRLPLKDKDFFFAWFASDLLWQSQIGQYWRVGLMWFHGVCFLFFLIQGERKRTFFKMAILAGLCGETLFRFHFIPQEQVHRLILFSLPLIWFWDHRHLHRWAFRPYVMYCLCYILIFFCSGSFFSGILWCLAAYFQAQVANYFLLKKWIDFRTKVVAL